MPFRSEAQRRFMYWAESKGKVPKGTTKKWEEHTKNKNLPEKVKKSVNQSYYISIDGDDIGSKVQLAEAMNDESKLKDISDRINQGQKLLEDWTEKQEGEVIESGGDEGLSKIPKKLDLSDVEKLRQEYKKLVGANLTVGIGETISESTKARMLGKLKGKNQTIVFDFNTEKELEKTLKDNKITEKDKIKKEGLDIIFKSLKNYISRKDNNIQRN